MKIRFYTMWNEKNILEHCHICFLNIMWQFDEYWKGIHIVILNFVIEIGNE